MEDIYMNMSEETLQREYERFRDECMKLTATNSELSREVTKLETMNERLLKIIENLSESE